MGVREGFGLARRASLKRALVLGRLEEVLTLECVISVCFPPFPWGGRNGLDHVTLYDQQNTMDRE